MDLIVALIIAFLLAVFAIWWYNGKPSDADIDNDGDVDTDDAKQAVENTVKGVKEDVSEVVEAVKKSLPTKSKLTAMKKADIEKVGKDFGIDLDRRKTKDNMIKDLQKHAKLNKH